MGSVSAPASPTPSELSFLLFPALASILNSFLSLKVYIGGWREPSLPATLSLLFAAFAILNCTNFMLLFQDSWAEVDRVKILLRI